MKISCEVIKDLLPLYHDGVCSKESSQLVEEHLTECDDCKAELKSMGDRLTVPDTKQNMAEAEAVKKLSKKWKKGMFKSLLKGALFTLITVIIFLLIVYLFVGIKIG